ncbi:MAG: AAA family ATPase [Clostridia bacterium]|nr:AAA family ATPase [Clostridia bacterium]
MVKNYGLDAEDEKILDELDNLFGVVQNKEVLRELITFIKLRQDSKMDFGNYNMIVRNESSYSLLGDFLQVCAKIFMKYKIIPNAKVCYLDKLVNIRKDSPLDKIAGIEESIIVINERKLRMNFSEQMDMLKNIVARYEDKIFVFEDTDFREGCLDAEIGEVASWRMTIECISLEDKIMYCKNKFEENGLKYKEKDLKEFADNPFWILRNMVFKVIIECKSKGLDFVDKQTLSKSKPKQNNKTSQRKRIKKIEEKTAKEEMDELIGLNDVKNQIEKILNYIKLNKERGKMPALHMCFTGNPGTGKTSIARIIGKLFEQEKILSGNGEFKEIHGRDLVAEYVGWTAGKVHDTVEESIGNVLFIDEAYSLVVDRKGSFEDEAIATLIKEMEDHRDEICIILAGYTEEMQNLIALNPGFESRIPFTINFPDYNETELFEIFIGLCKKEKYNLPKDCKALIIDHFKEAKQTPNFGNGRYVRNFFEKIKFEQADRIAKTNSKSINQITQKDIQTVIGQFSPQKAQKRVIGF